MINLKLGFRKMSWHLDDQSKADFLENEANDDISVGSVGRRLNSIVSLELLFTSKGQEYKDINMITH